jgi:hypothetical protein
VSEIETEAFGGEGIDMWGRVSQPGSECADRVGAHVIDRDQ